MSEKRFYWLKLPEDFFRQKEIKRLRQISGGDTFVIVYLKMLLLSLKDDGRLYYENIMEDFISELAANCGGQRPLVRSKTATVRCQRPPVEND